MKYVAILVCLACGEPVGGEPEQSGEVSSGAGAGSDRATNEASVGGGRPNRGGAERETAEEGVVEGSAGDNEGGAVEEGATDR
ncbi:MAG: hypothetical protein AAGE52_22435, partial [Myxococcota bacterium]